MIHTFLTAPSTKMADPDQEQIDSGIEKADPAKEVKADHF